MTDPDTQAQIDDLRARLDQLGSANSIPRDVETAFTERLGGLSDISDLMLWGVVTLVAGSATITDARITTASAITVTSENSHNTFTFNNSLGAVCNNGNAVIFEGSSSSIDPVNYIIVF